MELNTPIVKKGRLVTSGSSIVITVPPEWLKENSLSAGEEVIIISNGDLRISKITKENVDRIRNQLNNPAGLPAKTDEVSIPPKTQFSA